MAYYHTRMNRPHSPSGPEYRITYINIPCSVRWHLPHHDTLPPHNPHPHPQPHADDRVVTDLHSIINLENTKDAIDITPMINVLAICL